jgi:hypothetical protein
MGPTDAQRNAQAAARRRIIRSDDQLTRRGQALIFTSRRDQALIFTSRRDQALIFTSRRDQA